MTHPLLRASVHATVITAMLAGATCAVFFSAPVGRVSLPMVTIPAAVTLIEEQDIVRKVLPTALSIPVIPLVAPIMVIREIAPLAVTEVLPKVVQEVVPKIAEARLLIPSIGVDAVIKEMGYTTEGAMAIPDSRVDVGWFEPGTVPGETGSAVIGGHNTWDDGTGVFILLDRLVIGDVVSVVDAQGVETAFIVRGMRTFDATDTDSGIFESTSGAHLNLITCSGIWDATAQGYPTRLVVFTEAVHAPKNSGT